MADSPMLHKILFQNCNCKMISNSSNRCWIQCASTRHKYWPNSRNCDIDTLMKFVKAFVSSSGCNSSMNEMQQKVFVKRNVPR